MAGSEIAGHGGRDRRQVLSAAQAAEIARYQRDEDHDKRPISSAGSSGSPVGETPNRATDAAESKRGQGS